MIEYPRGTRGYGWLTANNDVVQSLNLINTTTIIQIISSTTGTSAKIPKREFFQQEMSQNRGSLMCCVIKSLIKSHS
jgi:hypothetical protein